MRDVLVALLLAAVALAPPWGVRGEDDLEHRLVAVTPLAAAAAQADGGPAPVRVIHDPRATYSAVAVDPPRDEVVFQDENLFQILVYNRTANTPPRAAMTEPKRLLAGSNTKLQFSCGLYIDPATGDVYSVDNDTGDSLYMFRHGKEGDVPPDRELEVPHGSYAIAVSEQHQELFVTVQHDNAVVAFRKNASEQESPVRLLQGDRTQLADPHGAAVDERRDLLFVANHGSTHGVSARTVGEGTAPARGRGKSNWPLSGDNMVPGSGRFLPPSITVYARTASGDAAPVRVISGPRTQLNWPANLAVAPERGELFVANDGGDSILVFRETDEGDAAPIRVIKGPRTKLKNPIGISIDFANRELWVASFGNYMGTVYPIDANGDAPPLRTIRAAPEGQLALGIGNPGAVAFDPTRQEILVPN
jgi:DNA-binding beta-propeller fold protein YncE